MKFKTAKLPRILRSTAGMTLVEIMMVVGLTGIVMSSIISMLQISAKQQLQATLTFQAQQIEKNLNKVLNDPNAWKATYVGNAANGATYMACLANNTPCTTNNQEPINGGVAVTGVPIYKIYDQTGTLIYDLTAPTTGFAPSGKTCTTWVAAPGVAPNNLCPLQFQITWDAKCAGANGSCVSPAAYIHIRAYYNPDPKLRVTFNAANYSTDFYQGSDGTQACDWGWSVTKSQLTEVCAPFVGVGVDSVTHFPTRMEVYGTEKIYGAPNTNGDNAVYLNAAGIDGGVSGVAIGYGNTYNGVSMANTAYINAESQGSQYRNLVLNPLATGTGNGWVGINTVSPTGTLDVQVDTGHKLLVRSSIGFGDSASIGAVNGNNTVWKPLELDGAPVILYATSGTNLSQGNFQVNGSTLLNGDTTIAASETVNSNVQIYGSETVNGNQTTGGSGQINGNLGVNGNVYVGALGNWLTAFLNQGVRTDNAPNFAGLTITSGPTNLNNGDLNVSNGNINLTGASDQLNITNGYMHVAQPGGTYHMEYQPAGAGRLMLYTGSNTPGFVQTDGGTYVTLALANGVGQAGTTTNSPFQLFSNNRPRVNITSDGSTQFINPGNGDWSAYVNGQFYADQVWSPAAVHISSDSRLKKDISPLQDSLDKILKLQGVSYHLKTDKQSAHIKDGFIAQDLKKVFPELVDVDPKGFFAVTYEGLISPIVEAIKALSAKIDKLISQQAELASENAKLKADNAAMQKRLDALEAIVNKK